MCIVDGVSQSCFHDDFNLLLNLKCYLISCNCLPYLVMIFLVDFNTPKKLKTYVHQMCYERLKRLIKCIMHNTR